jgi:hypothetical protein
MEMPSTYSWKARIAPVILMAVPPVSLALVAVAWLPGATRLWTCVGAATLLLAGEIGRDRGRRRQAEVWAAWGGAPTTRRMRHRDADNAALHARRHRLLQRVVGDDLPLPDAEREAADPVGADQIYETATGVLRVRTHADRDRFPLVHAELASYGFRRNLVGLKPYAVAVAVGTLLLTIAVGAVLLAFHHRAGVSSLVLPLVVNAVALVGWWRISDAWVRPVAEAYADRLLDSVETLGADAPGGQDAS